jgi:hypothetical protein
MIVLLTTNAIGSTYVQQEIGVGRGKGKLVVLLVDTSVEKPDLGLMQGMEYVPFDFSDPSPESTAAVMAAFRQITLHQEQQRQAATAAKPQIIFPPTYVKVPAGSGSVAFNQDFRLNRDELIVATTVVGLALLGLYLSSRG